MKHALLLLAIISMGAVGCQTPSQVSNQACPGGQSAGYGQYAGPAPGGGAGCLPRNSPDYVPQIPRGAQRAAQPSGPSAATTNYPYYTTRAPRDFLLDEPSTIGY